MSSRWKPRALSLEEARRLTDELKAAPRLELERLLALFEGGAHTAFGYSWDEYCVAVLEMDCARSYRLLEAARIYRLTPADRA